MLIPNLKQYFTLEVNMKPILAFWGFCLQKGQRYTKPIILDAPHIDPNQFGKTWQNSTFEERFELCLNDIFNVRKPV